MNEQDRENLKYILHKGRDEESMEQWFKSLPISEQEYAIEILRQANDDLRYSIKATEDLEISDFTEASKYLKKFRL